MTDEQKEAVEWLRYVADTNVPEWAKRAEHARTILAMLAGPRLPRPEDVPEHVLEKMWWATAPNGSHCDVARATYRALYDHYTAPRTKTVEVWRVEAAFKGDAEANEAWLPVTRTYMNERSARAAAGDFTLPNWRCIRVTGPHQQEVPDDQG